MIIVLILKYRKTSYNKDKVVSTFDICVEADHMTLDYVVNINNTLGMKSYVKTIRNEFSSEWEFIKNSCDQLYTGYDIFEEEKMCFYKHKPRNKNTAQRIKRLDGSVQFFSTF